LKSRIFVTDLSHPYVHTRVAVIMYPKPQLSLLEIILSALLLSARVCGQNSEDGQGSGTVPSSGGQADGSQGADHSYSMTKGSFIAIIVVVVVVAVLGGQSANVPLDLNAS
jgi:hypothetical protein